MIIIVGYQAVGVENEILVTGIGDGLLHVNNPTGSSAQE